ncbi:TIGR02757 family protein [Hydrogenimonas sp.]
MSEKDFTGLRERLEAEAARRDSPDELSLQRPDPLLVAKELHDERAILLCSLFAYGNAGKIVELLRSFDFSLLEKSEEEIRRGLCGSYYRFQTTEDVIQIFITLKRLGNGEMEEVFLRGYLREHSVVEGVFELIKVFEKLNPYDSRGYRFLTGSLPKTSRPSSPYKRWMMFLRWMVRKDALDLGRWSGVSRRDLIIPLDTHTFHTGRSLGLLKRKSYDWKAAVELTEALKKFSPDDPLKYDFALYRIGQERLLKEGS